MDWTVQKIGTSEYNYVKQIGPLGDDDTSDCTASNWWRSTGRLRSENWWWSIDWWQKCNCTALNWWRRTGRMVSVGWKRVIQANASTWSSSIHSSTMMRAIALLRIDGDGLVGWIGRVPVRRIYMSECNDVKQLDPLGNDDTSDCTGLNRWRRTGMLRSVVW